MEYYYDRIFPWYGTGYSLLGLAVAVLAIIGMWKVFEKAGEPGWAAIIPFYNAYVLFKITWGEGWMFLDADSNRQLRDLHHHDGQARQSVQPQRRVRRRADLPGRDLYCILGFDTSSYIGVPQRA
jgi:hypothetical protein